MTKKGGKHPHPRGCRCPIHAGRRGGGGRRPRHMRGVAYVSHSGGRRQKTITQMIVGAVRKVKTVAKHLLPTALVSAGCVLPFIDGGATSGYTAAQSFGNVFTGGGGVPRSTSLADSVYNLKENLKADWWEAGGLIVAGVGAGAVLRAVP